MAGVDVGGHQHLEIGELPLGQLQTDGVDLLRGQVILLVKGLHKVVVLSARLSYPNRSLVSRISS